MKNQCDISRCKTLKDLKRTKCNNECMSMYHCMVACKYKATKRRNSVNKDGVDCSNCLTQSTFRQKESHFTACGY